MNERPCRTYMSEPLIDRPNFTNADRCPGMGRTPDALLGDLATRSASREDFA
ncbi:MAG: hypothetical protein VXA43_02930 [Candidatus Poseidoniales archaeon]